MNMKISMMAWYHRQEASVIMLCKPYVPFPSDPVIGVYVFSVSSWMWCLRHTNTHLGAFLGKGGIVQKLAVKWSHQTRDCEWYLTFSWGWKSHPYKSVWFINSIFKFSFRCNKRHPSINLTSFVLQPFQVLEEGLSPADCSHLVLSLELQRNTWLFHSRLAAVALVRSTRQYLTMPTLPAMTSKVRSLRTAPP